ncbi:hypothetical protein [Lignipirellula cremea]|uniref:Uncharacterized protein n=1 Tax=Lignipirellula cremea TaxID=2528010 RepID=A0A518DZ12_9BACT|nr:hypothetical protein [Lignipirellula cremea]QDU97087.1 hypothetical protein Pla8534_49130 [Lignipirellula cremea]
MTRQLAFAASLCAIALLAANGCCLLTDHGGCGGFPCDGGCAAAPYGPEPACGIQPSCGCGTRGGCGTGGCGQRTCGLGVDYCEPCGCNNWDPEGRPAASPMSHLGLLTSFGGGCAGCGEVYWGEWRSDPPCCEPCHPYAACFVGPRCCGSWWDGLGALWGHRKRGGCGGGCTSCGGGDCGCAGGGYAHGGFEGGVQYESGYSGGMPHEAQPMPTYSEPTPYRSGPPQPIPSRPGGSAPAAPKESPFKRETSPGAPMAPGNPNAVNYRAVNRGPAYPRPTASRYNTAVRPVSHDARQTPRTSAQPGRLPTPMPSQPPSSAMRIAPPEIVVETGPLRPVR